jgi:hypothetical protein
VVPDDEEGSDSWECDIFAVFLGLQSC